MTATKTKTLSWKAIRRGDIYCAPGCGGGCKYAAFELATQRATELAARLGPKWKIRVHENLGWHYSVHSPCGRINVREYWRTPHSDHLVETLATLVPDHYTAYLNTDGGSGGRWTASADTPEEAIRAALESAQNERDTLVELVNAIAPLVGALKETE